MDVSRSVTEAYKIWLAGGGLLLLLLWYRIPRAWGRQALAALVLLAGLNYARWGPEAATVRLDAYDLLHYYVNAKYFDELGYYDLYPAVLLVDAENKGPFFDRQGPVYMAQDDRGHHLEPIPKGIERGREVRAERFTEERWRAFEHDVLVLQRDIGCRDRNSKGRCLREIDDTLWEQLINDHGFNGTTAWLVLARPLATLVPVESLKLLAYVDVGLMAVAMGLAAWAYGGTAAGWTALWLLVSYSTRWPYLSWVFLRYDWLAALIAATALLKKGHPLAAGFLAGWSSTLRLFPAMWMWGPFGKGVAGLFRREVSRPLLVLAGGFLLGVAVFQGIATVSVGPDQVATHFENMLDHNKAEQLSSRRIGLALALATEPWQGTALEPVLSPERKLRIDQQQPIRFAIAGVVLLALAWGLRRSRDDEAFAFGFLPFYLLTTASYYYYVSRVTLVLVHAGDLDRPRHRVGLALLFTLELFCNWAETTFKQHRLFLIGELAWGLFAYTLLMVGWLLWEARGAGAAEAEAEAEAR